MKAILLAVFPLAALAAACASVSPTAKAATVERIQCDSGSSERNAAVIRALKVVESEPIYSYMASNAGDNDLRVVAGAKVLVRPPEGVSVDQLSRILQCHSAQVLLGEQARTADPFWLADTWLTIEVKPERGAYAVTLEAGSVTDNLKVAKHAAAFAKGQDLAGNGIDQ
jgi:hypothetical protein